ncbi:MAG TPA: Imm50 family immunity protein [Cellvibrionaceae bacterium]|nr:Imm50 family immunity protein [Cellvibrionaceae bacterium]HNG59637.1 Imm50 family immunity protein [Cellvibrionaceae bacterium]
MTDYQAEVVEFFGYWPAFCDGHVVSYENTGNSIKLRIDYIDSDKSLRALVEISFQEVSDAYLSDYVPESVVSNLSILRGSQHWVSLEPCYGLGGSFKCKSVQAVIVNS